METWNLNFTRIDNQVQVVFNGYKIYDSGVIDNDPDLNIDVPLNCTPGRNDLNITLLNTDGPPPLDNPYGVAYTLTNAKGVVISTVDFDAPAKSNPLVGGPVYTMGLPFNV